MHQNSRLKLIGASPFPSQLYCFGIGLAASQIQINSLGSFSIPRHITHINMPAVFIYP
jgi:hypothetical protein